jgi:hypothetical protein
VASCLKHPHIAPPPGNLSNWDETQGILFPGTTGTLFPLSISSVQLILADARRKTSKPTKNAIKQIAKCSRDIQVAPPNIRVCPNDSLGTKREMIRSVGSPEGAYDRTAV